MPTHSLRRACLIAGATLVGLALPSLASAQTPPAPTVVTPPAADPHAAYVGTYTYAGGQRERTELDHAIDRAVDGMFFVAAAVARGRLHSKNPISSRVTVALPPGQISIGYDGRAPYISPDNGERVPRRDLNNDPVRVSQHWENGHLVQIIATDEGYRRGDLVVSADGHTLTLNVELVSPQLPHHLRYTLTFRR